MRYLINFLYKVFRFRHNIYPYFHPDRPYFVNLAYLYENIYPHFYSYFFLLRNELYSLTKNYEHSANVQRHYLKYLNKFGPEKKLPGFLMTNQQMIEFIRYQKGCLKLQSKELISFYFFSKKIFNCPIDEDEDGDIYEDYEWEW